MHSVPDGEEVGLVPLRNSRVDSRPEIARLLRRDGVNDDSRDGGVNGRKRCSGGDGGEEKVFAIYGTDNTWLFKARSEREKVEWIWRIDQSYFELESGSASAGSNDEE